jgi:serine/threonine protein kinase
MGSGQGESGQDLSWLRQYYTPEKDDTPETEVRAHAVPSAAARFNLTPLSSEKYEKVCNAIAFAHSRGVIHLDLKPANIHVSKFGEVLVLDWGLAKQVGEKEATDSGIVQQAPGGGLSDLTLPGAVKGTLGFMAPEQARGENSRKDKRTDVYALGAILYALLTLKAPPSSDTAEKVLADTVAGNIVPPRRRAPGRRIPAALEAVAMKALSVDPQKRYQSVEALSGDVDAFVGGYATSAQDAGIVALLWLLMKRHKVRFALSALVLLVVAAIAAVSFVRIRASERTAVAQPEG